MITTHGGGTSRKRMHAAADYSGAEIMRTLRDEVWNREIPVVDFTAAIELILDENGHAAGAVLLNMETGRHLIARAKTVIISTGGAGRLHYQASPPPTTTAPPPTASSSAIARAWPLLYADTLQYHPTGAAYPLQIYGALVTEKVRSMGAMLINAEGEAFMHPLETRDVSAASIIRECKARGKGVTTPEGQAVWLDTPMIDMIHGEGTLEKRLPAMLRMFLKYGIDMRKVPILVYPTLHYQNGGLRGQRPVRELHPRPLRGRRGRRRHPWPQPPDGQLPAGRHRLWPSGRHLRRQGQQGRASWQAHARACEQVHGRVEGRRHRADRGIPEAAAALRANRRRQVNPSKPSAVSHPGNGAFAVLAVF